MSRDDLRFAEFGTCFGTRFLVIELPDRNEVRDARVET
jgi:hypothetical protein